MAIKPGMGGRKSKNPPIFSHEFVIQNHADIISCFAMIFVVGLMVQATSSIASVFISLHHNVSGQDPSQENPRGKLFLYESGVKDYCAVFFYTLICIIMHAILQEYVLDKISKKLHLSKYKLSLFNESGQLVVFYLMSFLWGVDIILREGYVSRFSLLWDHFPNHPMIFLHKLFFIIQLAYYLHMLPELYFQKIKKEDQQPKIIHAICSFMIIGAGYFLGFQRIGLVLLTLHYLGEMFAHTFQLIGVFDKEEKYSSWRFINSIVFVAVRFTTLVIAVLSLYYGVTNKEDQATKGFITLIAIIIVQGYLIFSFITEELRASRERKREAKQLSKEKKTKNINSTKKRKKESDLPEADQKNEKYL